MYKTIFEGENVTHSSRKLEFLLGIEHQNIVFQAEIQFFFPAVQNLFLTLDGLLWTKKAIKIYNSILIPNWK